MSDDAPASQIVRITVGGREVEYLPGFPVGTDSDSPIEDWALVRLADAGSCIARQRIAVLARAARVAAIAADVIVRECLGLLGYTSERSEVWSERTRDEQFVHDGHVWRLVRQTCRVPVQGRGESTVGDVQLVLLPSAVRAGRLVVYAQC